MTSDHEQPESLRAAQLRSDGLGLEIPDGWYYDDYESGTWLVVINSLVVKDGIPTREDAIRIYHEWQA